MKTEPQNIEQGMLNDEVFLLLRFDIPGDLNILFP